MTKVIVSFDAAAYAASLASAKEGWSVSDFRSDKVAQQGLAALISGELEPLALAMTFYNVMKPKDAKGRLCAPKEADNGTLRVRNLEQADCKGSAGARSCLESVLYIFTNRDVAPDMVDAFAMGLKHDNKVIRLNPLKKHIRDEKAKAAKAAADATAPEADDDDDGEKVEAEAVTNADRLGDALNLLKQVSNASDASERLILTAIAAEIDRIGNASEVETEEKAAA